MSNKPRPTKSFEQLVSETNRDALKPFIEEHVSQVMSKVATQMMQNSYSIQASLHFRLASVEKILREKLDETEESLNLRLYELEDEALLLSEVLDRGIEEGDTIRFSARPSAIPEAKMVPQIFRNLHKNRVSKEEHPIVDALIGMKKGESKTITLEKGDLELRIDRISKSNKPEPKNNPNNPPLVSKEDLMKELKGE